MRSANTGNSGSGVDLRELRYFAAVAETRNLSRAAGAAHVAQPALSRQMHDLEEALGVKLLERHARGVTPTLAGEALARGATQFLADIATAIDRADGVAAGRQGRVVMGVMLTALATGIPAQVDEQLRREHPELNLVLQDSDPPVITEQLESGSFDLALAYDSSLTPSLIAEPLWRESVNHALLPAEHPLAGRSSITLPDLGTFPVIIPQRTMVPEWWTKFVDALRPLGMRSSVLVLGVGIRGVHISVAAGRGWSLIAESRAKGALPQGTTAVPVEGLDLPLTGCVLWRRGEQRPVVRTVLEAVLAVARDLPTSCLRAHPELPKIEKHRAAAHSRRTPGTVPAALGVRHLRALLVVAAAQSIGQAAEQLGISQPSLSRQLLELERETGLELFERSARGVLLTPAGSALAGECPALLQGLERIVQETTRARRGMEGRCVIGAVNTTVTSDLLTSLVGTALERHPNVRIAIEEMPTPRQVPALTAGDIDLGLAHTYVVLEAHPGCRLDHLVDDRVDSAIVGMHHPLARYRALEASQLVEVPFLFMERQFSPALYDRVYKALAKLGLKPRVDGTHNELPTVWSLAAQGKGWCIGFRSQRRHPPTGTVAIPIEGFDVPWGIDVVTRVGDRNPAVGVVMDLLRKAAKQRAKARRSA